MIKCLAIWYRMPPEREEEKEGEVWIIIDKFCHPIKNVLYFPKLLAIWVSDVSKSV